MASPPRSTSSGLAAAIAAHFPSDAEATIAPVDGGYVCVLTHRGAVAKFTLTGAEVNWVDLKNGDRTGWLDSCVAFIHEQLEPIGVRQVWASPATPRMEKSLLRRGFVPSGHRLVLEL